MGHFIDTCISLPVRNGGVARYVEYYGTNVLQFFHMIVAGSAVWLELKPGIYKSAPWSVLLGNFRPYSSRVVAMAVALIHDWHYFQLYCSYR